jgi:hypothetical protein
VDALEEESVLTMEIQRDALASGWRQSEVPGWAMAEVTAGDATLEWEVDEQVAALEGMFARARTAQSASTRLREDG